MKRFQKSKFVLAILMALMALNPMSLFACSVCYGDPNSSMSKGLVWGIFVLLGVIVAVLGGISTFFVYIAKKSPNETDKV
ncbi:MAG TPA: hypothetical protein VFM25_01915 [Verrucomicrobiae bacterium]|nr:hypothetical protein [Verrucomicrobiae bacterium]